MKREDVIKIVELRTELIKRFEKFRDYKNNPNAIMKEVDCVRVITFAITALDEILAEHVQFK